MALVRFALAALAMLVLPAEAAAQGDPPANLPAPARQQTVAATVAGEPVYVGEATRPVRILIQHRNLVGRERAMLEAEVLSQLIRQRLVKIYLSKHGALATKHDVDQVIKKFESNLAAQNHTLAEVLAQQSTTEGDLRRQIEWELSWNKYAQAQLTDARLEEYFDAHRGEFDGSEVHASHILLRPVQGDSKPAEIAALVARAKEIRQEILGGKINFADAAKQYSQGPSGSKGGDLGFFPRHGAMVEPFSQAAFALDADQISQPVITQFGVHLIQVTERKHGNKKWSDVRSQLLGATKAELLEKLAQEQLATTPVTFTGALPYFKPGTRQLVMPGPGDK